MQPGERPALKVDLRLTSTRAELPGGDDKGGRGFVIRGLWALINAVLMQNPVLGAYAFKARVLRLFGARIGRDVVLKPGVNIKYPWFLEIGDYTWIGERAWLDCTSPLKIGSHCVISQGAYLCCGMHDWQDPGMGSMQTPIVVEDGAWIAAHALIAGNVTVGQEAMVTMGAVVFGDCEPRGAYRGNPATRFGTRRIRDYPGPRRPVRPRDAAAPP